MRMTRERGSDDARGPVDRSTNRSSAPTCIRRPARATRLAARLLLVLLVCGAAACRDPDRAILAGLSAPERARFERGRSAAVPCWTCHDLAGSVDKVGPSLVGVFGRRSGRAPDQQGSDALLAASIVWDERSLAAFLSDPSGFVPGTTMVSPGVRSPDALSDLIFYLHHVTRPGARADTGR